MQATFARLKCVGLELGVVGILRLDRLEILTISNFSVFHVS